MNPKILFLDLETAPNLGFTWGKYEQDVIEFEKEFYVLCFSAKWSDEKRVMTFALPDFPAYKKDKENDRPLMVVLHSLFNEADIIIAHNGDKFDIRVANQRFFVHKFKPPSPYKTIDTLKLAKKLGHFNSNRLNDLGKILGIGEKVETGGFKLWKSCMQGFPSAWKKMKQYNKQDVILLEKVYHRLMAWIPVPPTVRPKDKGEAPVHCPVPTCPSRIFQRRGRYLSLSGIKQIWQCRDCGKYFHQGEYQGV